MNKIEKLIGEHKQYLEETRYQLSEILLIDCSKFSAKEKEQIDISILELQLEVSLRSVFLNEIEDLL